jgi:membrane protein YqaA with SNARE-associated domain
VSRASLPSAPPPPLDPQSTDPTAAAEEPVPRPGLYRRFYEWVLHWAYTRYAQPALFLISFAESSFFPIPPDVLLLPMCLGDRRRAMRFALICSVASVLGGIFGYVLGMAFWNAGLDQFCFAYVPGFTEAKFAKIQGIYDQWAFWAVFVAGFSPIPYKLFTIAAGVFAINFPMFVLASVVSRSARFFLEAGLLRIWGDQIKGFIDRWLATLSLLFCVALVGGFYLVKVVLG